MSLINIGAGLAEMGKNIAATAGEAGLAQQKADLQMQATQLADQLATTRETTMENLRSGHEDARLDRQNDFARDRLEYSANREDARTDKAHGYRLDEISAETKARIATAAAERNMSLNDLNYVETDASGKKYGVTKTGKKVDLGITGPNDNDEKLMARAEKFSMTKKTVVDPNTGDKTTEEEIDPQKAYDFLVRQNRRDLAAGYKKPAASEAPAIPPGLPPGAQYSPSRKQWRDQKGNLYDETGKPLSAPGAGQGSILNGMPIGGGG